MQTNLTCTGRTPAEIEHKLNADLSNVNDWLEANMVDIEHRQNRIYVNSLKKKT
jgi:hypothetical protein